MAATSSDATRRGKWHPHPPRRVQTDMPPSTPMREPEQLLQDLAGLRHLAVALVGASEADDLLQDAAYAALAAKQHPPRPGAFLRGVLRNLAGKRHRARSRRRHHEGAATTEQGSSPPTLDVVAHSERIRALTNALVTLAEPYREALLLRYFSALPPGEIATRLGVPLATVKSRLQRGLAMLRVRLDTDDERNWRNSLLVALGLEDKVLRAPVLWTPMVGVTAALIALTITALWAVWPAAPLPPDVAGHAAMAASAGGASREGAGRSENQSIARVAVTTTPSTQWSARYDVRGRCVDEHGQPLAQLAVRITNAPAPKGIPEPGQLVYATATTATDGTFALGIDRQPLDQRLEVEVSRHWVQTLPLRFGHAFERRDLGDVTVAGTVNLHGRVVDRLGLPRSGAVIHLRAIQSGTGYARPVRSDADGRFSVALPAGEFHCNVENELPIERENYLITVGPGGPDLLVRVEALSRLKSLSGLVVDALGATLRGVAVTVHDPAGNRFTTVTDAAGRFTVHNTYIMEFGPLDLDLRHEGYDAGRFPAHATWGMQGLRFSLRPLATVALEVVSAATGAPVEEFTVRTQLAATDSDSSEPGFPTRSGERRPDGRTQLTGLLRGRHRVLVQPAGGSGLGPVLTHIDVDDGATLRIELPRACKRLLRVTFADGTPLPGCHVELQLGRYPARGMAQRPEELNLVKTGSGALLLQAAVTDERGEVMLIGPADTELTVVAFGPRCRRTSAKHIDLTRTEPLLVPVVGVGSVRVRLTPIELLPRFDNLIRFGLRPFGAAPHASGNTIAVSATGEALLQQVPDDHEATLFLTLGRMTNDLRTVRANRDATTEVLIDVREFLPGTLHGYLQSATGQALPERRIRLRRQRPNGEWERSGTVKSDVDGRFTFRGLPGRYQLDWMEVAPTPQETKAVPQFDLLADRTVQVTFGPED